MKTLLSFVLFSLIVSQEAAYAQTASPQSCYCDKDNTAPQPSKEAIAVTTETAPEEAEADSDAASGSGAAVLTEEPEEMEAASDTASVNSVTEATGDPDEAETPAVGDICEDPYGLQECIDTAYTNGGGTVELGAQTYKLYESLVLESNVNIVGKGAQSVITWDDSVADTIDHPLIDRDGDNHGPLNNVILEDFKLLCTVDVNDVSDNHRVTHRGIFMTGKRGSVGETKGEPGAQTHENITMNRIEITQCGGEAIKIHSIHNFSATDLYLHSNGWGDEDLWHNMYLYGLNKVTIKQTMSEGAGFKNSPAGHGMRLSELQDVYLENLSVTGNADHGIHMTNITNLRGHNLQSSGNCQDLMDTCDDIACYKTCDYDVEAAKE